MKLKKPLLPVSTSAVCVVVPRTASRRCPSVFHIHVAIGVYFHVSGIVGVEHHFLELLRVGHVPVLHVEQVVFLPPPDKARLDRVGDNARLQAGGFMEAFLSKGRLSELMQQIPVKVILEAKVGLLGASRLAMRLAYEQL